MQQVKCEMCGSTDLLKDNGVFVCQSCGMKYTVEEAKKMMVEGVVEVQGTVRVDNSSKIRNLYEIARRSKDTNNSENAAKYYDMILVEDPSSWEANFYVVYFQAMGCKIAQIQSAAVSITNCVGIVLKLIKENEKNEQVCANAVNEVAMRCSQISNMLFTAATNHYIGIDSQIRGNYVQEYVNNGCAVRDIMYVLGDNIEKFFGDHKNLCNTALEMWKIGIGYHNSLMPHFKDRKINANLMAGYIAKVHKYEPSYKAPHTGGCYVATAVYGSYDCPQVWTLRRYRDNTLAATWYGRAFIHTYYAVSPTLVKWFGDTEWFKTLWRGKLDKMVKNLQNDGVESVPYQDKEWR